jgi:glycosyltransferase involved in cell wall biosynthesis
MRSDTLVIIPAYNEERNISDLIHSIKQLYPDMDVAVIDDGSSDATAQLAGRAGAHVLSHPFNMGYGVSLQTGYKYAVLRDYRFVVQVDGDGQHDPGGIGTLLDNVRTNASDIVLGSRFLAQNDYKPSIFRLTGIRIFSVVLRLLSGREVKDVTTGFQAMNRKVLDVFVSDIFPYDYPDADVILLLSGLGFRIKEVPVTMYPNKEGKSMHRSPLNALYYIFKMILSMFLTKMRKY